MQSANGWIKENLEKSGMRKDIVYSKYQSFKEETGSTKDLEPFKRHVRRIYSDMEANNSPTEISEEDYIKIEAKVQGLQDKNNFVRKLNREGYRVQNVLEGLNQELITALKEVDLGKFDIKEHKDISSKKYGVIQITDAHFNEWIEPHDSGNNEYDFHIASKRLKKFITKCIGLLEHSKVKEVFLVFTGDLINSSRRNSEKLVQITSQARASLLGVSLLTQVITELSKKFRVTVSSVVGNESRIAEISQMDNSELLASENWDYMIFHSLIHIFEGTAVRFDIPKNNVKHILTLPNGFNILLFHGHTLKSSDKIDKAVSMQLYEYMHRGIPINMVLMGHFHHSAVGDLVSKCGSLCGSNSYSAIDLGFISRASQNLYIVNEDKGYDGFKIDLQKVDGVVGYSIDEKLEMYNVSHRKPNNRIISENLV